MAIFDFLRVDRIKFNLALAGQWAHGYICPNFFFNKNCTEICSSADIYAIRNLDEGNNNSLSALL